MPPTRARTRGAKRRTQTGRTIPARDGENHHLPRMNPDRIPVADVKVTTTTTGGPQKIVERVKAVEVEARRTASRLKAARVTPTTANLETGRLASQTLALPLLRQVPRRVMPCLLSNVLSLTSRPPPLQFNLPPSYQLRSLRLSQSTPPSSNRACKLGLASRNPMTRPDIARLPQLVPLITTTRCHPTLRTWVS